ncbi:MAG: VanZ family protein [Gaiellaceae bacterium]
MRQRRKLVLAASVLAILAFTMPPSGGENVLQLRPFGEISGLISNPRDLSQDFDILGNVLLFMPFGVAMAFATRVGLRRTVAAGAVLSAAIEIAQLVIPGRWTSVDDFILNTFGAAVGYVAWVTLAHRQRRLRRVAAQFGLTD